MATGSWSTTSRVENTGPISGYYSLDDTLAIDVPAKQSVVSAEAKDPSGSVVAGWDGDSVVNLATDRFLVGNTTENWTVTVVVDVAARRHRHPHRDLRHRGGPERLPQLRRCSR